jgi:hypothetical protein
MAKIPIPDPGTYDERHEEMIREMISRHAAYAESGKTFDPKGTYLCGDCDMRIEPKGCMVVKGSISMEHGSCTWWEGGKPIGKPFPKKADPWLVGYGERSKGFGCSRCEYAVVAKQPDDDNRKLWCGFWGTRVKDTACCEENDGHDLREPYHVSIKNLTEEHGLKVLKKGLSK